MPTFVLRSNPTVPFISVRVQNERDDLNIFWRAAGRLGTLRSTSECRGAFVVVVVVGENGRGILDKMRARSKLLVCAMETGNGRGRLSSSHWLFGLLAWASSSGSVTKSRDRSPNFDITVGALRQTFVKVDWDWISMPDVLLILVLAFLVSVSASTRGSCFKSWKEDNIAMLLHGNAQQAGRRFLRAT
ncbi:uncharacterized protein PV09_02397 [Verruconis gallopava]|uniref:Uncharacterized protein n=1 Tax=Verruconis gallopava TaxID=253628 RepID=A0A0D1Z162_9PEZI|nr:uncharacterized protein PV09_02397 [Verruconis gallopava]KIW06697.1 hypothetical protein PV09_02397 [Verruconis gallopava]